MAVYDEGMVGRRLGKRIDAHEWDVVVRCNHYYGAPEDVGTRTDHAVVRMAKLERAFFDEAATRTVACGLHQRWEQPPAKPGAAGSGGSRTQ